jgi:hypothetical protein
MGGGCARAAGRGGSGGFEVGCALGGRCNDDVCVVPWYWGYETDRTLGSGEGSRGRRASAEGRVEGRSRSWNSFEDVLSDERNVSVSLGGGDECSGVDLGREHIHTLRGTHGGRRE